MDVREHFAAMGGARPGRIRVLQFGEGNFLRAFADQMIDSANDALGLDMGVWIVQPIRQGRAEALNAQAGLYTVLLRGMENGAPVKRAQLVRCVLGATDPYRDFAAYLRLAGEPHLRFIISNTTEAGIVYTGQDRYDDAPPASFPGKLTRFLHARFLAGLPGFILLPCELIDHNGAALKDAVVRTAVQWRLGGGFIEWLMDDNVFCSTLVDRIVTGYPGREARDICAYLGYDDPSLVVAEPFGLWVIEGDARVQKELPLDGAGCPVVFTRDVAPYKARKVRLLNGAHTALVSGAYLSGLDTVGECMADENTRAFLSHALTDEIVPFVPLPRREALSFAADVCARFENPYNRHELLSIALNSVSKYAARVLPSLADYVAANRAVPPCLCFGLSALIMFYAGARPGADGAYYALRAGAPYPVRDSDYVLSAFSRLSCDMPPESLAYAVLSDRELWGADLRQVPGLEDAVAAQLRDIQLLGVKAAMRGAWEAHGSV